MRRIIDGRVYDTENAELLAEVCYSTPRDFRHTFQKLYHTKKGRYFFHGGGGPLTEYAESVGNGSTSGSERLWVVEEEEAIQWLAKVDPDKALDMFPEAFEEG